ncbi:unnamed protein product [Porites evermanni]|uniref:Uncharacterized protein n=1 Tax=Porites evermanni TaxID=104178 RepID=A0ABN8SR55_9CNID|nr:unnamed protein product [Porites evermanni]
MQKRQFPIPELLINLIYVLWGYIILGDPGADNGDDGKSKRAEKCGTKKSKERREEPLGTMSYQTSSKWPPPLWLLIGARKLVFFWHQSGEGRALLKMPVWEATQPVNVFKEFSSTSLKKI